MSWSDFKRDSDNVRQELVGQPDAEFYPKQAAFQKVLLDQPRFFRSEYFYEKYETQARQNLADYYDIIRENLPGD